LARASASSAATEKRMLVAILKIVEDSLLRN